MAIIFDVNQYKYSKKGPLDAKALVKKYADLVNPDTWLINGSIAAYNGMVTAVYLNTTDTTKNGVYFLYDPTVTNAVKAPDVTVEANWHKLSSADDLTELTNKVNAINATVAQMADELSYKADAESVFTKDETIVAIAEAINKIPEVDLTPYAKIADVNLAISAINAELAKKSNADDVYTKAETDAALLAVVGELPEGATVSGLITQTKNDFNTSISGLASRTSAAEEAIAVLNGDGEGSVQKTVSDAIAEISVATTEELGLVKASDEISVDEDGTMKIEEVSTDKLTQGVEVLVLDGGDAVSPK